MLFGKKQKIPTLRDVYLLGPVCKENMRTVQEDIKRLYIENPEEYIVFHISSGGGHVDVGMSFYEHMRYVVKPKLRTIISGNASSMAIPIFLTGDERFMTFNSCLGLHELSTTFEMATLKLSSLEKVLAELQRDQSLYINIIEKETKNKFSSGKILDYMRQEKMIFADEALELGLINNVLV